MKDKRQRLETYAHILPAIYVDPTHNMRTNSYSMPPYGYYGYNMAPMMYPMQTFNSLSSIQQPAPISMANNIYSGCSYRYSPYSVPQKTQTAIQHTYSTGARLDYLPKATELKMKKPKLFQPYALEGC